MGMTYDTMHDVLVILDRTIVHVAPDERGAGAVEIASGTAAFARREKTVRFDRDVKLQRGGQLLEADAAVAHHGRRSRSVDGIAAAPGSKEKPAAVDCRS
jgi:hypothetical protein